MDFIHKKLPKVSSLAMKKSYSPTEVIVFIRPLERKSIDSVNDPRTYRFPDPRGSGRMEIPQSSSIPPRFFAHLKFPELSILEMKTSPLHAGWPVLFKT